MELSFMAGLPWVKEHTSLIFSSEGQTLESPNDKLSVPAIERPDIRRNLIHQAICELRFPAVLELENERPLTFQKAIRKQYPHYKVRKNVNIGPESIERAIHHTFIDKKKHWFVTLKSSSLGLETLNYHGYERLRENVEYLIDKSKSTRDSDFFTRIGLRYINVLPVGQRNLAGWIREELVAPLVTGSYGNVEQCWQIVTGEGRTGRYLFQHGLPGNAPTGVKDWSEAPRYVIDIDFYEEDVEVRDAIETLNQLHQQSFDLFWWALGDVARAHLTSDDE
jgi:uncharacterized protein (TIGR04255 family)